MRLRYPLVSSLALAGLLAASVAIAAKQISPVVEPLGSDPITQFNFGTPRVNAPCNLGVSTGAAYIVNYLLPPDDAYYTLLDPAASCACPGNAVQLNAAHMLINFQTVCVQPIRVRIVPAVLVAPGCYEPDVNSTLCGPLFYNLAPGAVGNFQFNLPLPAGCCIQGPAFLDINFINPGAGCSTAATRPRLITTANCAPCTSWNVYPNGFDDLCDPAIALPGNPVMWADGDCCAATPTLPHTWGRLKTLYR